MSPYSLIFLPIALATEPSHLPRARRSIRYPSVFNGLYGFRPSSTRVPYSGAVNTLEGIDTIPSVLGPLSNSLSGVKAFLKAVVGCEPWKLDPLCVRKKWDEDAYRLADRGNGKQLCFAIMADDGNAIPHPPIQRALKMAEAALVTAGHKGECGVVDSRMDG